MKNNISYCGDLLRSNDKDWFLISLFTPSIVREGVWALFAFNYEISKTRYVVSDTNLGLIRLQWWRDEIARIYDGQDIVDHEILKPLSHAIKSYNLPQELFNELLYAREFDLEDVAPANIEGLMNYADFTTTPLLKLALGICGVNYEQEIIQPIAINFTLTNILRSANHNMRQGFYLLPDDLMQKYNAANDRGGIINVARDIALSRHKKTNPDNVVLKACEVLGDIYFKQLSRLDYDVSSFLLQREPAFKALRLFWKIKIM